MTPLHCTAQYKYRLDILSSAGTHPDAQYDWGGWQGGAADVGREIEQRVGRSRDDRMHELASVACGWLAGWLMDWLMDWLMGLELCICMSWKGIGM